MCCPRKRLRLVGCPSVGPRWRHARLIHSAICPVYDAIPLSVGACAPCRGAYRWHLRHLPTQTFASMSIGKATSTIRMWLRSGAGKSSLAVLAEVARPPRERPDRHPARPAFRRATRGSKGGGMTFAGRGLPRGRRTEKKFL